MELIRFIIISTIIVIMLGCCFLANNNTIINYFKQTTITKYGRYDINIVDDNDINNMTLILPEDTLNNIARRITKGISSKPRDKFTKTKTNDTLVDANANAVISDNELISDYLNSGEKNYGKELPWDKEIGYCDVLKGTDRDLYKNVQDSTIITFY